MAVLDEKTISVAQVEEPATVPEFTEFNIVSYQEVTS